MRNPMLAAARCVLTLLLLFPDGPAWAQETTGTITGVVTDQSGAVLANATVTITNIRTGQTREVVTNQNGRYTATLLPVSEYTIKFSLTGFQPATIAGVSLHVNDRLEINGTLGVSGVAEAIEVKAESTPVQPTPTVQALIGPTQLQELPINNRNFVQLAVLVPGVSSDLDDEANFGLSSRASISINGARRNGVNWLLDGASNVDVGSNITLLATPTLESIEEFKILTSSYSAEWPRSGGGVISVVTKSGAGQFSGSAYEFVRNDQFNANSFFRKLSPATVNDPARLRYNNFGYTIGGPALPVEKNLFFFFSEEWRRIKRQPASRIANVPLPQWLTDPTNPNYVPPAERDANAVALLAAWPAPNVPGTTQFVNVVPDINNTRQEVVRLDYDLSSNWRLMGRYTHDLSDTLEPGGLFFNINVPGIATTRTSVPGNVGVGRLTTIIGGGSLNELSYQLSGNRIATENPEGTRNTKSQFGLTTVELFPENAGNRVPIIRISGLTDSTIGATQPINIEYINHTLADNFTLNRGSHTYKAGLLLAFEQKNENAASTTQGDLRSPAAGGFRHFRTSCAATRTAPAVPLAPTPKRRTISQRTFASGATKGLCRIRGARPGR